MKLYEIAQSYQGLMLMEEDLPEDAFINTLESITDELEVKAENIIKVIANMDTAPIDAEIKRLQHMKAAVTNRSDGLKDYLSRNMIACDINKISWPTGSITLRAAPPIVVIESEDLIPDEYKEKVETVKIHKAEIANDLKRGVAVPGARLGDGKRGLMIR